MDHPPPADFQEAASALGLALAPQQLEQLAAFVGLFAEASAQFNLTALREPQEIWLRHVLDSLSLIPFLPTVSGQRVVDVGSGGGLPGLVLAIARPELQYTLIDATGKKVRHIANLASALGLSQIQAVHGRAEELTGYHGGNPGPHREQYQVAVARALAPLPVLLELVVPFVASGGSFVAIKGQRAQEELEQASRALNVLHTRLSAQTRTSTGTVLCFRKEKSTPRKYPRRPGEPKRDPL